ncbi:MAG: TonB family protein [Sulfuricurvum sp.]|nr:TonB family protein [Sulfuricurvum sp.]MDD5386075.1 TonB family protein [Sulfuricurvum sp.]
MILHNRPLGISLLLHALVLGLFLFGLLSAVQKKQDEPLKIHLSSFATPVHQSIQPPLPPKQQAPLPIPKNIPASSIVSTPAKPSPPIAARPTPPTPITQTIPQPLPTVVSAPTPVAPPKTVVPTPQLPPAPPINVEKEFINEHLGEIRGLLLQNLKYPKMAQKLKMQGEVRIAFSLGSDGSVEDIKIIESSGFDLLDEDARTLIEKTASRFPKPSKSVRISVPLSYVLR